MNARVVRWLSIGAMALLVLGALGAIGFAVFLDAAMQEAFSASFPTLARIAA